MKGNFKFLARAHLSLGPALPPVSGLCILSNNEEKRCKGGNFSPVFCYFRLHSLPIVRSTRARSVHCKLQSTSTRARGSLRDRSTERERGEIPEEGGRCFCTLHTQALCIIPASLKEGRRILARPLFQSASSSLSAYQKPPLLYCSLSLSMQRCKAWRVL